MEEGCWATWREKGAGGGLKCLGRQFANHTHPPWLPIWLNRSLINQNRVKNFHFRLYLKNYYIKNYNFIFPAPISSVITSRAFQNFNCTLGYWDINTLSIFLRQSFLNQLISVFPNFHPQEKSGCRVLVLVGFERGGAPFSII